MPKRSRLEPFLVLMFMAAALSVAFVSTVNSQSPERPGKPADLLLGANAPTPALVVGAPGEVFDLKPGQVECGKDHPDRCEVKGGAAYVFGLRRSARSFDSEPFELIPMQRLTADNGNEAGSLDNFGFSSLLADLDGDGREDLVVGNWGGGRGTLVNASRPGLVHVLRFQRSAFRQEQSLLPASHVPLGTPGAQGMSLALVDINNDGFPELVAGSPGHPNSELGGVGAIFVYRNQGAELAHLPGLFLPGPIIVNGVSLQGDGGQHTFGSSLAAGDFNGDGIDDLAVGAPKAINAAGNSAGLVFEFHGDGERLVGIKRIDQSGFSPNEAGDFFGHTMIAADFDGDGFDDLAVSAPSETLTSQLENAGLVFLFRGSLDGLVAANFLDPRTVPGAMVDGSYFGTSLTAGDFDGDGVVELAVGAPGYRSAALVDGVPAARSLARRDLGRAIDRGAALCGNDPARPRDSRLCDRGTSSLGSAGIKTLPRIGAVFVFQFGENEWELEQSLSFGGKDQQGQFFGWAVGARDLDLDGITDLFAGAPLRRTPGPVQTRSGEAFIYLGGDEGLRMVQQLRQTGLDQEEEDDRFGASFSTPGSKSLQGLIFLFGSD